MIKQVNGKQGKEGKHERNREYLKISEWNGGETENRGKIGNNVLEGVIREKEKQRREGKHGGEKQEG